MSSIMQSPDILAALQQRKKVTARRLQASQQRVLDASATFTSSRKTADGKPSISRLVSNGIAAYEGIRIFLNVFSAVRTLFGHRRRRR